MTGRAPLLALFGPSPRRRWVLWGLFVAALVFGAAQLPALGAMDDRGTGIIEFELARTSDRAAEIVSGWGDEGRSAATESLILDYPYLLAYGLFFAGACAVVAERAARLGKRRLARAGVILAWASLASAVFDAVENAGLLVVASDDPDQPWPGLAFTFAVLKFACISPSWLYAIAGWFATRRA